MAVYILQSILAVGHVFTIMFPFKGEQHMAMVTVLNEAEKNEVFQVKLFNKELQQLFSNEFITFSTTDQQLPDDMNNPEAEGQFQLIKQAIYQHLYEQSMTESGNTIKGDKHDSDTIP